MADTDAMTTSALRFVGPETGVHDKTADLATHEGGLIVFKASNLLELEAHVFGTTGLSIALIELELDVNGELVIGTYCFTRTWLCEDDRWQIAGRISLANSLVNE